jgi:hypothetical protein
MDFGRMVKLFGSLFRVADNVLQIGDVADFEH